VNYKNSEPLSGLEPASLAIISLEGNDLSTAPHGSYESDIWMEFYSSSFFPSSQYIFEKILISQSECVQAHDA